MNGIFIVNKAKGPTSNDVIQVIKRAVNDKVGHAGTLDPLASGVLVVGIGREGTKQLKDILNSDKEYVATITLGQTSTTDDEEGSKTVLRVDSPPTAAEIKAVLQKFIGEIKQAPPNFSAIKVGGTPAYEYARKGKKINLGFRSVSIHAIALISYDYPELKIKVTTGSGVYIRSLARDIGQRLQVGGYLSDLVRSRVGDYTLEQARSVEDLISR